MGVAREVAGEEKPEAGRRPRPAAPGWRALLDQEDVDVVAAVEDRVPEPGERLERPGREARHRLPLLLQNVFRPSSRRNPEERDGQLPTDQLFVADEEDPSAPEGDAGHETDGAGSLSS